MSSDPSAPRFTNRLIHEKSPYLLQHAHNPVDWYPWGEDAFEKAKSEDKPIFLSIGYATCHWCHVMERECFENLELAKIMNDLFVNIKVDREELPDVDAMYMEMAMAMMSGSGGWPLNLILTPDLKPFYASTYLPAESRHGIMGLRQLCEQISRVWDHQDEKEHVLLQADKVIEVFEDQSIEESTQLPDDQEIFDAAEVMFRVADATYGGTKGAPKFPVAGQALFFLRFSRKTGDSRALYFVDKSLDMMHRGGIYDHLGGGFSRYSVDDRWLVPHFEKMLYDNAMLLRAYTEAWQYTKEPLYREVAEDIISYLLRDMTHKDGGVYSAQDADSSGSEGLFYTWSLDEVYQVLGDKEGQLFCDFYDVTYGGNYEGRNILHMKERVEKYAKIGNLDVHDLKQRLQASRQKLWKYREKRPKPLIDDKIITSWNGLIIYSLTQAGMAFNKPEYVLHALKAALFIRENLYDEDNKLLRRWREGEARFAACLDDYASLIQGAISLFEATGEPQWLAWAIEMTGILEREFKSEEGAFYLSNGQDPYLLLQRVDLYDGAEPSGNAIHCDNLLRLYQLTNEEPYLVQAEDILATAQHHLTRHPTGACYHLVALQRYLDTHAVRIVIALDEQESLREPIERLLWEHFIPHKVIVWRHYNHAPLREVLPSAEDQGCIDNKTTVHICYEDHCDTPCNDLVSITKAIKNL